MVDLKKRMARGWITADEAENLTGIPKQQLRLMLRSGNPKFDWLGFCFKREGSKNYTYYFNRNSILNYMNNN